MKISWKFHEKLTFHFIFTSTVGNGSSKHFTSFSFHNFRETEVLNFTSLISFRSWNEINEVVREIVSVHFFQQKETPETGEWKGREWFVVTKKQGRLTPNRYCRSSKSLLIQKLSVYHVQLFKFRWLSMCPWTREESVCLYRYTR